jgi:hypothetical protein
MSSRRQSRLIVMAAVACAFAACVADAWAAEVSRSEYREAAEPICKVDTKANERILATVRQEVRQGALGSAAAKFMAASRALKKALGQLEALPRPAADEARLAKWFATVKAEAGYFEAVSRKLAAGQKRAAESFVTKLTVTAMKANDQVLPFEFTYCRLEPSRFT